jgi:hypothetical protein
VAEFVIVIALALIAFVGILVTFPMVAGIFLCWALLIIGIRNAAWPVTTTNRPMGLALIGLSVILWFVLPRILPTGPIGGF